MKPVKSYKKIIIYIFTLLFSILFLTVGYFVNRSPIDEQSFDQSYIAKVTKIEEKVEETVDYSYESYTTKEIKFRAQIKNSNLKDKEILAYQYIDEIIAVNPKEIEVGDTVLISLLTSRTSQENKVWTFIEYYRTNTLIILLAGFFILILLLGRRKGINTVLSLVITCLSIFMVYVPSIIKGNNIYISSIIISVFIIFTSLILLNGFNKKTICAITGNLGGLFIAGLLAFVMSNILNLTGLINEDSTYLITINSSNPIDLIAILWGSIVIGSLGAVMDVSMSISSALNELSENMDNKNFRTLFNSGMNIGRDAIGTMANTLVLAYIGSSLSVVLLLFVYYKDVLLLFNLEMIIFEILQSIIGSMGILFAIPITSFFSAYIYNSNKIK